MNNGKSLGALNPISVPLQLYGTGRLTTLTLWEYTRQAGFTTIINFEVQKKNEDLPSNPNAVRFSTLTGFTFVPNRKVRRRKRGSGIMSEYDSCFRRRSEDLSAYEVSDSVWINKEDLSLNPNVPVEVHGTGRLTTLTPWEYTGQAGFWSVQNLNVYRRNRRMINNDMINDLNLWITDYVFRPVSVPGS